VAACARLGLPLVDHRHDRAHDQVHTRSYRDRHDRLDVQRVLDRAVLADAAVQVVLQRDADQGGHRVGQFLGQILIVLVGDRDGTAPEKKRQRRDEKPSL
jgi:hypothetical protein